MASSKAEPKDTEFVLPERTQVTIRRNDPWEGRTTIYLTPAGSFTAKKLEVPSKAFLAACVDLSDEMDAERKALEKKKESPPESPGD